MKKSTITLPFSYRPIDVLVNLFANVSKIKVPRISGSLVKLSEIKILCGLYCFFHIYLSMCWSIFLQILVISRFHVLVGLLWNWMRSKFLLNCIAFFMSTIDVLVNLFANLNTIKVPRVRGSVVKLSEIKILSLWIVKSLLWNEVNIEVLEMEKVVSLINCQYHTKCFFFQGQL